MKRTILLAFLFVGPYAGCEKGEAIVPNDTTLVRPIIIFDDRTSVNISTDAAFITEFGLQHNVLRLRVLYAGGCTPHEFVLYGWSGFSKSKPAQAEVFLSHNANGDPCDALIRDDLAFDLSHLKETYKRAFNDEGPLLLRIYPPGVSDPIQPLPRYDF